MLPDFAYHPDPLSTGSVKASDAACVCCGQRRGYVYTGPVYCVGTLASEPCIWCIADGSLAARYDAELIDVCDAPGNVPRETIEIIRRRTPGFSGWQQERRLFHCGDGAAFLGPVGAAKLAAFPDARETLRFEHSTGGWSPEQVDDFLAALDEDGDPTAYLFRCRTCGAHLAYADFT
ncbi:CbrC family protein [Nonomuraea indica]|uniref:CbrC family protein n=1 Tax=Nonomuraea indica TaxID=1581193 RepID=UPI000C7D4A2B|nr:CbrC family protein [Nonomuraea indica]